MAVVVMFDAPNETAAQYDALTAETGLVGKLPPGCRARIAGPGPGGSWRVISVWDDMDTASAFMLTTQRPAVEKSGFIPQNGPPITWTLHELVV